MSCIGGARNKARWLSLLIKLYVRAAGLNREPPKGLGDGRDRFEWRRHGSPAIADMRMAGSTAIKVRRQQALMARTDCLIEQHPYFWLWHV